jgi:hypothetical protein
MTVTSIFDIHLGPDPSPADYGVVHDVAAQTYAYVGNTGVQVLLDHADPAHLVVVGAWNSLAEFHTYEAWRAGDGSPVALSALLSEPPAATVYLPAPVPTSTTASPTTMKGTS